MRARKHKEMSIWAAGIGLTLMSFLLGMKASAGNQKVPCPPPCPCKEVTFWRSPGVAIYGAFQAGSQPGVNTTTSTAFPLVNTGNGNCHNTPLNGNGTYDRWQIPFGTNSCDPGQSLNITELDVPQAQIGVVPRTNSPGLPANTCSP